MDDIHLIVDRILAPCRSIEHAYDALRYLGTFRSTRKFTELERGIASLNACVAAAANGESATPFDYATLCRIGNAAALVSRAIDTVLTDGFNQEDDSCDAGADLEQMVARVFAQPHMLERLVRSVTDVILYFEQSVEYAEAEL